MSIFSYEPTTQTETPVAGLAQVDNALSSTSTNPVQNNVIKQALDDVDADITAEATARANADSAFTSEIADMNNILGAKNVLPNNATSQVVDGVTFTVNNDGSIQVSGTASAQAWYRINYLVPIKWADNTYVISKHTGVETWGYIQVKLFDSSKETLRTYDVTSDGDTLIELSSDAAYISTFIIVTNGKTVNTTVYPMVRPASIKDDTYVPYAMTNRELTEKNSSPVLLWTNPNPSVSFGAQTISLDLSKYRFVEVYTQSGSTGVESYCRARVGGSEVQLLHCTATTDATYGTISNFRTVTASSTGVTFSNDRQTYTGSAPITVNTYNIPQEIWGIK